MLKAMFVDCNLEHWKYKLVIAWNLGKIQCLSSLFLIFIKLNLV